MSSTPFSRTMRSLDADSFGPSLVALIFAMILLLLWCFWFFLARIPITEVSQSVEIAQDEKIVATFPPKAMARLQEGQSAFLRLGGMWSERVPAIMMEINYPRGQVELFAEENLSFIDGVMGEVEQVEIEVEEVSPATLVMRASGLFTTPSPQYSNQ